MGKGSVAGVLGKPIGSSGYFLNEDLNELKNNGIYTVYDTTQADKTIINYPTSEMYWLVTVFKTAEGNWIKQVATSILYHYSYERIWDSSKGWGAWYRVDNFGYNTLAELSAGVANVMGVKHGVIKKDIPTTMKLGSGFLFLNIGGSHSSLFHLDYWTNAVSLIGGKPLEALGSIVQTTDKYSFTITMNGTDAKYYFIGYGVD